MYEKQTWTNGDVITADKLNHMEYGISRLVSVPWAGDELTGKMVLGMTWQELYDAVEDDAYIFIKIFDEYDGVSAYSLYPLVAIGHNEDDDKWYFADFMGFQSFTCASADDYPSFEEDGGGLPLA